MSGVGAYIVVGPLFGAVLLFLALANGAAARTASLVS